MTISAEDKQVLREIALKYMSYATLPVQEETKKLWIAHNARKGVKPMVLIDQMPWNELDVDGFLVCKVQDPYWRNVEWNLRMEIYKWEHLPVDMVLNPYILFPRPVGNTGYGIEIQKHTIATDITNSVVAYEFTNQFEEMEDVEKIKTPVITKHEDTEREIMACASEIFDGIAECRWQSFVLHVGLWDFITQWMGVENCYIELMDRPELMHAIMSRLTDATISMIEQINKLGLYDIDTNLCHCSHTFTNELPGPDCDRSHPTSHDGWGFGLAQLFTSVSPAITDEFEVPYMQKIFPYFGAVYYGCCDRLDDRLDIVDKMPNIRKISCSPWSDRDHFAAVLKKDKYIMSNKPNPALLAADTFDEDVIREDLRHTIRAAKENGVTLEMIQKDISTVKYQPQRLWRWAEIAKEETLNASL